ncbi:MAG: Phosphopantetheine adenylyltransferase [Pseudomonadota bacterium]|jgi:pantetheine-phosphate adenylyltransferase
MARIGFYAGSFDPVTHGHSDVIVRALSIVDELVIGIGVHHGKEPMFSAKERIAMLEEETAAIAEKQDAEIRVVTFDSLVVDAARENGASVIIRGLRDGTDFDYEIQMAGMNSDMAPDVETVFLPASPGVRHIAASLVRQIAGMGGDVSKFVSPLVAKRLEAKVQAARKKGAIAGPGARK